MAATVMHITDARTPRGTGQCANCGRQTARLDDEENCPVCRLYHLAAEETGITTSLDAVGDAIHSAIVNGYAHPDDVRKLVDDMLGRPEITEWRSSRHRLDEARAAVQAQAEALRAEVA
jgi:hypothetical protein